MGAVNAGSATPAGDTPGRRGVRIAAVTALDLARLLVLARILSPDDFGLFAIAVTAVALVTSLAAVLAAPGVGTAPDGDATWTLGVARGILVAGVLAAIAAPVAAVFHEPRAAPVLRVVALLPLIAAIAPSGAPRTFVAAAANSVIAIALAPFIGVWALVAGALGGAAAGAAASSAGAARRPRLLLARARLRPALALALGGWMVAAGALAAAADFVLHAGVARQLGAGALGVFAVAAGLTVRPITAAAEALRGVAAPLYARLVSDPPALRRAFRGFATGLTVVAVPLCAVLAAGAGGIAEHVLGARWGGAAPVLRVLAAAGVLGVLGQAAVPLFGGVAQPRLVAGLAAAQLVAVAFLVPRLTAEQGLTGAALAWLGAAGVSLLVSRALLRRLLGPAPEMRYRIGVIIASGVAAGVVTLGVAAVVAGRAGVLVGMAAGLAVAAAVLRHTDRSWRLGIGEELRVLFPK